MLGFGKKNQKSQADFEKEILESKIALRKLMEKLKQMLAREIATARKLKEQGLKSSSNYSKIGVSYYLLQFVQKAYNRLDDIASSAELGQLMQGLNTVIEEINHIGTKAAKPKASGLLSNIGKMQNAQKTDNDSLASLLKGLSTSVAEPAANDISGLVDIDTIERLINGGVSETSDIPADAVPIAASVRTQSAAGTVSAAQDAAAETAQKTVPNTVYNTAAKAAVQPETSAGEYNEEENLRMLQQLINKL